MDIRQLRYFISVAETESFSESSRQCFLSQSAISQQIKALEEELGAILFIRDTRGVCLTEAGQHLLPHAREAVKSFELCTESISELHGVAGGKLCLGMTYAHEPFIRRAMIEVMRNHPKLQINVYYKTTPELRSMLYSHDIDMAFTINKSEPSDGIESTPIFSYKLCLAMSSTHPLANKSDISISDLEGQSFVLPERNSSATKTLESMLGTTLSKFKVKSYINSPNAILNLLQETRLVSILSADSVMSRKSLVAKPLAELSEPVQCYAHTLKDVCMKHSSIVFLKELKQIVRAYSVF